jgi:DNA gyrase/topoisomerase IV subunit B
MRATTRIRRKLMKTLFKAGKTKVEISRFKGLGEMPPSQLRETTMDPKKPGFAHLERRWPLLFFPLRS